MQHPDDVLGRAVSEWNREKKVQLRRKDSKGWKGNEHKHAEALEATLRLEATDSRLTSGEEGRMTAARKMLWLGAILNHHWVVSEAALLQVSRWSFKPHGNHAYAILSSLGPWSLDGGIVDTLTSLASDEWQYLCCLSRQLLAWSVGEGVRNGQSVETHPSLAGEAEA